MCGICGIIDFNKNSSIDEQVLKKMCKALEHRGPDDEGIYIHNELPSIGLGHRRLSIIDLSSAGHQPMFNEDGTVWIVFNGEIYNYKELRIELENKGHIFKSNTDTETIIHLYEEYGQDCVKYLRGMFAFAIWDKRKEMLFLARDRVGKKPLLYSRRGGTFCFSSEFASILESGLIEKKINPRALDYYLTFGYIPAPLTIYEGVFKLPPAHTMTVCKNEIAIKRYWNLNYSPKLRISEKEAQEEIFRLLEDAVKIRMYSDVPLGAFLSGGIDSSTVVAIMSRLSAGKIKTFSIGFEDNDYNEISYARNIARMYNTEHHEFIVRPNALEVLPLLVERYGEPYADSSCLPTYYVSKETRNYVTVALNGDGGDESFAGYERYQAMIVAETLNRMPGIFKKSIRTLAGLLPDSIAPKSRLRRIRRFFESAFLPVYKRYSRWIGIFDDSIKDELYSEGLKRDIYGFEAAALIEPFFKKSGFSVNLDDLLDADVHTYLPEDLLVKVDIASMANSLEARSPFLDHKLMEFAAKLPAEYKLRRGIKKYILKKTIKGIVPDENVYRAKMGFGVPVGRWFREDLKDYISDTLLCSESLKRGYFKPEILRILVKEHTEGRKDYFFHLWALLMLELWHRRFMD